MPPPAQPREPDVSWLKVEENLGIALLDDFKEFIRFYGSGRISNFVCVLNPSSKSVNINLLEASRDPSDTLRDARDDGELIPYALYPDSGGLLPVAATDNGDIIYWLTRGDAADWIIVVNGSRSDDYEEFEC